MTLTEIKDLIIFAKSKGIVKLKVDSVEVEFSLLALTPNEPMTTEGQKIMSEDQLLYWSSGYDPEEDKEQKIMSGA